MLILLSFAALALCLHAAIHDVRTLTIPNWLNLAIALLALPAILLAAPDLKAMNGYWFAATVAFLVSGCLFYAGVFGGGDAKMIPAVMLWIGAEGALTFVMWMALAGGLLALVVMAARRLVPAGAAGRISPALQDGSGVPYGVAIAAGALAAIPHSDLFDPFIREISRLN